MTHLLRSIFLAGSLLVAAQAQAGSDELDSGADDADASSDGNKAPPQTLGKDKTVAELQLPEQGCSVGPHAGDLLSGGLIVATLYARRRWLHGNERPVRRHALRSGPGHDSQS